MSANTAHLEAFARTIANALCDWSSWSRHSRTTESMSRARSYASKACSHLMLTKTEAKQTEAKQGQGLTLTPCAVVMVSQVFSTFLRRRSG